MFGLKGIKEFVWTEEKGVLFRLKGIKEFHRRHPGEISVPMSIEFDDLKKIRENPADDTTVLPFRYEIRGRTLVPCGWVQFNTDHVIITAPSFLVEFIAINILPHSMYNKEH